MTRGTRVMRATLAVRTTQAHCPQTTRQAQAATTTTAKYHVILVDFLKKKIIVVGSLALAETREVVSFFQMVFVITKMPIRWTAS